MAVSYNFIKNDNAASTELTSTREGKIREKRERRMVLPSNGVVAKTAWRGIPCSSVVKSSACKFSEEKTNQIVLLCVNVFVSKL